MKYLLLAFMNHATHPGYFAWLDPEIKSEGWNQGGVGELTAAKVVQWFSFLNYEKYPGHLVFSSIYWRYPCGEEPTCWILQILCWGFWNHFPRQLKMSYTAFLNKYYRGNNVIFPLIDHTSFIFLELGDRKMNSMKPSFNIDEEHVGMATMAEMLNKQLASLGS